jgi:hypothetical protein
VDVAAFEHAYGEDGQRQCAVPCEAAAGRDRPGRASVHDRDGAESVMLNTYLRTPVRFVFADGGGDRLEQVARQPGWMTRPLMTLKS